MSGQSRRVILSVSLGLAVLGTVSGCGSIHTRIVEWKHPRIGEFIVVPVDGGSIRVNHVDSLKSPSEDRAVVFIHGSFGSINDFRATEDSLVEFDDISCILGKMAKDYRVIAYDRPGHGYSDRPTKFKGKGMSPEDHAKVLYSFLVQKELLPAQEGKEPILVGHSWGGAVALAYAVKYPGDLSGLVLLGVQAYPNLEWLHQCFYSCLSKPVIGPIVLELTGIQIWAPCVFLNKEIDKALSPNVKEASKYKELFRDMLLRPKQFRSEVLDDLKMQAIGDEMACGYLSIRCPVYILTGAGDKICPPAKHADKLFDAIARSRADKTTLTIVEPAKRGHLLMIFHPDDVEKGIKTVSGQAP